ncbi:MAG TPA: NAD(P)-dependent alcohol dehydrogenase [bacterium]|nr:NAD(P)-dependent alcohol dehydrogenase [bacterium]
MKACVLRKDNISLAGVEIVDMPDPEPGPDEVLIKVRAASLNYRDYLIVTDNYATAGVDHDVILLSDAAGEVAATGGNVSRFKTGDRVAGTFFQVWKNGPMTYHPPALGVPLEGVLAEYITLHEDGVVAVPPSLSFEEAASLPCAGVTAWNATMVAGQSVRPGETVLSLGTGGVSLFAAQFAAAAGARLILTSSSDEKLERALSLFPGRDVMGINYNKIPDWEKEVMKITGGRGADHIIELGGPGTLSRSYQALAFGGKIALIGFRPDNTGDCNPGPLMQKDGRIHGVGVGNTSMFEEMNRAIEINRIKPHVDKVFPLAETVDAFRLLGSGKFVGKIAISIL